MEKYSAVQELTLSLCPIEHSTIVVMQRLRSSSRMKPHMVFRSERIAARTLGIALRGNSRKPSDGSSDQRQPTREDGPRNQLRAAWRTPHPGTWWTKVLSHLLLVTTSPGQAWPGSSPARSVVYYCVVLYINYSIVTSKRRRRRIYFILYNTTLYYTVHCCYTIL